MERKCSICKIVKPLTAEIFVSSKYRLYGLSYECKECCRIRSRAKYISNPRKDRYAKMTKAQKIRKHKWTNDYKRNNYKGRSLAKYVAYKEIDKKKGFQFDLTKEFIEEKLKQPCMYCGDLNFNKMGLDRLDNSIGHLKTNVVPCCDECNIARSDHFTHEEMLIIGIAIKQVKDSRFPLLKIV